MSPCYCSHRNIGMPNTFGHLIAKPPNYFVVFLKHQKTSQIMSWYTKSIFQNTTKTPDLLWSLYSIIFIMDKSSLLHQMPITVISYSTKIGGQCH